MSADSQLKFEVDREALNNVPFEFGFLDDSVDRRQVFISQGPPKRLTVRRRVKVFAHFPLVGASDYEREARAFISEHETWTRWNRSTLLNLIPLLCRWPMIGESYAEKIGFAGDQKPGTRLAVTDFGTVPDQETDRGNLVENAEFAAIPGPVIGRGNLEGSADFAMLPGAGTDRGGLDESNVLLLKGHVETAARETVMDGWAEGGASAVDTDVVANAKRLIDDLPKLDVLPEVATTEHGEIRFDWAPTNTCTLTLTVGADHQIGLAGLFDDTLVSGKERWKRGLPQLVQCCLERLRSYDMEAQSGPASAHRNVSERRLRDRVLKAIEDAEETWQGASSIARRSALPEELVLKVLYEDSSDVIYEQRASGKVVFSTRAHYLKNASAAQKLLGAFRNRLR